MVSRVTKTVPQDATGSAGPRPPATTSAVLIALLLGFTCTARSADIEQVLDSHVHTVSGTAGANAVVKLGRNADGGDYVCLLKWDESDPGFSSFNKATLRFNNLLNDSDGSFAIHQMVTDWDESTDFGTNLPVAGVDYAVHPVAAGGLNDDDKKQDTVDFGHLVQAWVNDPALNKGVIVVPRTNPNANYPATFDAEIQLAARERVVGLDTDDIRIITTNDLPLFSATRLEAVEDAGINSADTNDLARSAPLISVGVEGATTQYALYKFGLGELQVTDPLSLPVVTSAVFEVHIVDSGQPAIQVDVHRMHVNWDEATVTWGQFGGAGPVAGADYEAAPLGTLTLGGGAPSDGLDITATVTDWIQNVSTNFGLILIAQGGTASKVTATTSERVPGGLDGDDTFLSVSIAPPLADPPVIIDFQPDGQLTFEADAAGLSEFIVEETMDPSGAWSNAVTGIAPTNFTLSAMVPLTNQDALLRVSGHPPSAVNINPGLPITAPASLAIYDAQGRMVRTLWTGETNGPGDSATWDGRDEDGNPMPVGTYTYKVIQLPATGVNAAHVATVGNGIGTNPGNEGGVHGLDMSDVDVDASDNIYLTGAGHGMALQKFDSAGNMLWIARRPSGPQGERTTSAVGNGYVYGADPVHFFRTDANTGSPAAWPSGGTEKSLGAPPVITRTYDRFGDTQELWVRPIFEGAYWSPSALDGLNAFLRPMHPNVDPVGGNLPPKRVFGMTVLGNEVFLSYRLEDKVEVRSGTTGDILRTISLTAPAGIVADSANNKLFVIRGTDIITMDPTGGNQQTLVNNGLIMPWGLAWNQSSSRLYATDLFSNATTGHTVKVFSSQTGMAISTFGDAGSLEGGVTATKLYAPLGIAIDSNSRILVAESMLHRLSIFSSLFVPDTALYGGIFNYAAFADPQQPERVYTIDGDQGSVREHILNYTNGTWTLNRYWNLGGPHPTRDLVGSPTQGTHIRHIGGFTYLVSYEDTIKIFRVDANRLVPVAIVGWRFRVNTQPGVFLPPGEPTIWVDQNSDEIATPGEISHPTPAMIQDMPFLDLGSRYEDTYCADDGTLYWGTFKLPLFDQQTNGVLHYRWEDLEHYGTDLDSIQDLLVCVDADEPGPRYFVVTELDNNRQQPGIGLHTDRTLACYLRKYDAAGTLLWETGSKAVSAHQPGEMYHPRGIETFAAGSPARRFVAVNDEPGIVHFWTADGLYIATVLRDMSINHPFQNYFWDFWYNPKYLSDPLVSTFGELWHMSAEVHPATGKVYVYTQSHEGGQHMRIHEITGLEDVVEITGQVEL